VIDFNLLESVVIAGAIGFWAVVAFAVARFIKRGALR
jgi:uncharacterized membrane protein YwzB